MQCVYVTCGSYVTNIVQSAVCLQTMSLRREGEER